jgi:hypothetical protein
MVPTITTLDDLQPGCPGWPEEAAQQSDLLSTTREDYLSGAFRTSQPESR